MKTRSNPQVLFRSPLALILLFSGAAMAQGVGLDAACNPQMTHVQQRLYDQAEIGTDALREFMFTRRGILQRDVYETATWAEAVRGARFFCRKELALKQPSNVAGTQLSSASLP